MVLLIFLKNIGQCIQVAFLSPSDLYDCCVAILSPIPLVASSYRYIKHNKK